MTKKYFTLVLVSLLSLSAFASQYQGMITLTLNGELRVMCTFDDEAETVTLGNGYNACISHYLEGELTIPGTYTNGSTTWKVVVAPMAFRFCTGLTKVTIEEGVEHIGDCAFVGCSGLTHITLPSTLQTVGSGAFSELASLRVVKCMATTAPTWQWNDVFAALGTKKSMEKMAGKRILYIPKGSIDSYLNTKFDGTSTGTSTTANEKVGWQEAFNRIYELTTEPQTIGSLAELKAFRNAVNSGEKYKNSLNNSVVLTADIDMASEDWTPIGTVAHPFDGVFDGGGHVIKNLCINLPTTDDVGLFGYAKNATIYNLHLQDPSVKGNEHVGTLLGSAFQVVRISDVLVTGSGTGDDYYTVSSDGLACGGIVGRANANFSIERCMFSGVIKGALSCGGILGDGYDVTISDCSASHYIQTDKKTDGSAVGGIVGYAVLGDIERCLTRNTLTQINGAINTKFGYVMGEIDDVDYQRTLSIDNCAYWGYSNDINTVGKILTDELLTFTESGNQSFATEAAMTGEAAKTTLGDGWHYFTGLYQDYPIPATLFDMYVNNVVYGTTNDGLIFAPIGNLSSFTEYQVVGYTGTAESVTIPAEFNNKPVTAIGNRAFYGSDITAINLGSVETIDKSAFEECDALQTVSLPNSVTTVKAQAFWNCDNLTSFTIGKNFQHHDGNFLAYCHKLQSLTVGAEGNSYGYLCQDNVLIHNYSNNNTTYIVACAPGKTGHYEIPTFSGYNYTHLIDNCFGGCTGLTSITFPDCVCYLPNGVFNGLTNLHYIDMYLATACNYNHTEQVYYTVDRRNNDNPFYGTNKATIIYLKYGHRSVTNREQNIVIGDKAFYLKLTDGWDFYPPTDITSTNGVSFDRKLQATRTEITRKTGKKIILKDEDDEDMEVDELVVTGYTYTPRGYSVCLPYNLTLTAENAKVFVPSAMTDGDDWRVTFTEVTDKKMTAYKPYYIVVSGEEEVNLSTNERNTYIPNAITSVYPQEVGSSDFEFKGTTKAISNASLYDATKPVYILQSDGNWHKVAANTEDAYVPSFRAYFQASTAKTANQIITMLNAIELSDMLDNSAVLSSYAGQTVSVTLRDRTLYKDGNWNTLCLPFDVTVGSGQMKDATVMTMNASTSGFNASTGELTLNFAGVNEGNTITAGTPFIVKWDKANDYDTNQAAYDETNPVFSGVTVTSTEAGSVLSADKNVRFLGTYNPAQIYSADHDNLYLGEENTLYWPSTSDYTLGACRAYFHVNLNGGASAVRQFVLNFGDSETTGILSTTNFTNYTNSDAWYDLSGRRLSGKPTAKGLYINGRKKVVIP